MPVWFRDGSEGARACTWASGRGVQVGAVGSGVDGDHPGAGSGLAAGTTFKVFLPLAQEEEAKAFAAADTSPTGDEHILLVDDEPALGKLLTKALEGLGYRVTLATSPREALDRFQATPEAFDLILTDQTMPEMTGDQLVRAMMKIRPGFPVIICTGYSDILDDTKARAMGIRALLMKPVGRAKLAETLRIVLDESV
ncbi:MAG: response regulator [Deferrisomatales bacterium]|nr:response regulator [Deferrisomatales bacterium]